MTTTKRGYKYQDIPFSSEASLPTLNTKFNNWITSEDGFVKGTLIFWTGTSGAGKTTFLTSILNDLPNEDTSIYSREMILKQLKHQLGPVVTNDRIEFIGKDTYPVFSEYMEYLWTIKPAVVVIDSMQDIAEADFPGLSLDAACLSIVNSLKDWAEQTNGIVILIGHVNKDDEFAGKNTIMHKVDIHVEMVNNKKNETYTFSFGKNRKGDKKKILYYEFISKGIIVLYTPEEYEEKLFAKQKPVPFLEAINKTIKMYENLAKGKPCEKAFKEDLKIAKSQIKKRVGDHEGGFAGELVTYLNSIITKHGIL